MIFFLCQNMFGDIASRKILPVGQCSDRLITQYSATSVSYTHLRAHETGRNLVCRLLLEKKKKKKYTKIL